MRSNLYLDTAFFSIDLLFIVFNSITIALSGILYQFSSVTQSCLTLRDSTDCSTQTVDCPSPIPGIYSNSCPLSRQCCPTISSSVIPFSSHLQSFPASTPFQMSQFFTSGSQNIGASVSASIIPMNIQD